MQISFRTGTLAALSMQLVPAFVVAGTAIWDYQDGHGPADWSDLDAAYALCAKGTHQSPIDIESVKAQPGRLDSLLTSYTPGPATITNNGRTIMVASHSAGGIHLDGEFYRLLQFHFHTPSETRIDHKEYMMEMHMVHRSSKGRLAVVAVMLTSGSENKALKAVFQQLPEENGKPVALHAFDPTHLIPQPSGYFSYLGSLTTPPCAENVAWRVMENPVEISNEQYAAFRKHYLRNARPVQPLNDRQVFESTY